MALVSVSIDLGAGRRGVDMGPSALRIAGVTEAVASLGYEVHEAGTVHAQGAEIAPGGEGVARYLDQIVDVASAAHGHVLRGLGHGRLPLVLGGDHSLSIGTISAVARFHRERGERVGVIWVDAHPDLNTPETTPSGNVHGMSLAVLLGLGPPELTSLGGGPPALAAEHVSVLGARRMDRGERDTLRSSGVRAFTMSEIDDRGLSGCVGDAIARGSRDTAGFYLSFDLDVIDPLHAPGVGTPVPGGITYREAHLICEKAARSGKLLGLEVVELNPVLDERNRTARLAVGLIASALGKSIL